MSHISHVELIIRIAVGAVLGAAIGFERYRRGQSAGIRTHLLVGMASSTFMVVSSQFVYWQHYGPRDLVEVDPSRIAASVVTGIGFLAGGTILRTGVNVQGLTTAAGVWVVTGIGLCAGAGMFTEAAAVTAMGIVALSVLRRFENKNDPYLRRRVSVVLSQGGDSLASVVAVFTACGATVSYVDVNHRLGGKPRVAATFDVGIPVAVSVAQLIASLEALPHVQRVRVRAT